MCAWGSAILIAAYLAQPHCCMHSLPAAFCYPNMQVRLPDNTKPGATFLVRCDACQQLLEVRQGGCLQNQVSSHEASWSLTPHSKAQQLPANCGNPYATA